MRASLTEQNLYTKPAFSFSLFCTSIHWGGIRSSSQAAGPGHAKRKPQPKLYQCVVIPIVSLVESLISVKPSPLGYVFIFIRRRAIWELVSFQILSANQRLDLALDQRHFWSESTAQDLNHFIDQLSMTKLFTLPIPLC